MPNNINTEEKVTITTPASSLPSEFIDLKSKEFKDLYYLYLDLLAAEQPPASIIAALSQKMSVAYGFPEEISMRIAKIIHTQFSSPSFSSKFIDNFNSPRKPRILQQGQDSPASQQLYLSTLDVQRFETLTSNDPHASVELKRFLLALMAVYRRNFHHSGWIRYDKKVILYLAGLQNMAPKDLEQLTQYLHQEYGFDMQVVGSNSPIPCFKIDWLFGQPQPGSHINPFLNYGDFAPSTITNIVTGAVSPQKIS